MSQEIFTKHKIKADIGRKKTKKNIVEEELLEMYSQNGELPDFKTIKIKKRRHPILSWLLRLFFLAVLIALIYWAISFFKTEPDSNSVLDISINAPAKISLGEEFFYEIDYFNSSNYKLEMVELNVEYPENFVLLEVYSIDKTDDNKSWVIENLGAKLGGKIKIRGKIINQERINNLLSLKTSYKISGLSSSFGREYFNSIMIQSLPFQVQEDYFSTVLVGEEYPLSLSLRNFPANNLNPLVLSFQGPENIFSIKLVEKEEENNVFTIEKISDYDFKIEFKEEGLSVLDKVEFDFKYRISQKEEGSDDFKWSLKYLDSEDHSLTFLERKVDLEVIKSDLHLSLIINDKSNDFPVSFGQDLDYTIKYSNKGDRDMKDLVIMAVIDNDFIDWNKLSDSNKGRLSRKTITWTSQEISQLKELAPGEGGEIKFSLALGDFKKLRSEQSLEVKSYAQFSIGNIEELKDGTENLSDNKSNILVNKINSDLEIEEKVFYFDEDNIPVGSGPLPPVVGEQSSFRYYWKLKNTLHELQDLNLTLDLPSYVIWDDNYNLSAGNLNFDPLNNRVSWNLSRWPLGVNEVNVDFSVSVIPNEGDYNKIMILSSGSNLEALDVETRDIIKKRTEAKTTRLEDDAIANLSSDGRVN